MILRDDSTRYRLLHQFNTRIFRVSSFCPFFFKRSNITPRFRDPCRLADEGDKRRNDGREGRRLRPIQKCRSDNLARLGLVKPGLGAAIQLTAVVCCLAYS